MTKVQAANVISRLSIMPFLGKVEKVKLEMKPEMGITAQTSEVPRVQEMLQISEVPQVQQMSQTSGAPQVQEMLYQFIFTTDEKLTIVYSILDRIPITLVFSHVNWCKIDVFTLNIMVLMFSL